MNKYLVKIAATQKKKAEESHTLRPHQERALKKLDEEGGVLLDHATGTGKTKLFLTALERAQKKDPTGRSLILAPASLTTNVDKEILKHKLKINMKNVDIMSYEKASLDADELKKNKYILAISDEGHKLRSPGTKRNTRLSEILSNADKRIVATATPTYNDASNIAPLLNIVAGKKVLPEDKKTFDDMYVHRHTQHAPLLKRIFGAPSREVTSLKNTKELSKHLNKYIDSYSNEGDAEAMTHFPTQSHTVHDIEMSPDQHQMYKYAEGKLPFYLRMKVRSGMPLNKREASQLNSFAGTIRQVSNTTRAYMPNLEKSSPKINAAVDSIQRRMKSDKNYKGVVYSNYLESGVHAYSHELGKRGIKHGMYTGELSKKEKDLLVSDYNSGKTKVMLISSSGAEGLDLKGTKHVVVSEPSWNGSKIRQVTGRAARYDSHKDLPLKERHVDIEHYHSVFPSTMFGKSKTTSIDKYLAHHSEEKDNLSEQMRALTTKA